MLYFAFFNLFPFFFSLFQIIRPDWIWPHLIVFSYDFYYL